MIRTGEYEVIDESENESACHRQCDQPGAGSLEWPHQSQPNQWAGQNDGKNKGICGWRERHFRHRVRGAMDQGDQEVRHHHNHHPQPYAAFAFAHTHETTHKGKT